MKKPFLILAIASILLNILLVYIFVFKGETFQTDDNRTEILMTANHRDFALDEMRTFLESVQQINDGILNNDAEKVVAAGKKSGGSVIDHAPAGFLKKLPMGFKQLGFATHDIFDEIAVSAGQHFNATESQEQLNKLLNNCIACHRSYKITTITE